MLKALLLSFTLASRAIALAAVLALAAMAMAQINLLANGSFEDTVNCSIPTQCTLLKAKHWYNPNLATPDVFDTDLEGSCGSPMIPDLGTDYIVPVDGQRLGGAIFWSPNGSTREYLMTVIPEALSSSHYEISLWYTRKSSHKYAVDHIGIWLGQDSLVEATTALLSVGSQVKLRDSVNEYLTDGDTWTQLVDTFLAVGGEHWLVIGNFEEPDSVNGIMADSSGLWNACYYYIDDVVIREIGATTITELERPEVWLTTHGLAFHWKLGKGSINAEVFDTAGRLIQRSTIKMSGGRGKMPITGLGNGIYLLQLEVAGTRGVVRFYWKEGVY